MPLSTYRKISEYFDRVENVHLQGWGEPLLNPDIFEMIRIAKGKNCSVSLTTSGVNLTADISGRLIKEGIDTVAVSIAGATKETHERIRRGSDFGKFVENIKGLAALKAETGSSKPKIVLSFLMTKLNYEELPDTVYLLKDVNADELVATNLDYAPATVQDEMRLFSCTEANENFKKVIERSEKEARKNKVPLRVYPLEMEEVVMCEMNPLRIIFMSHDGCIAPCVYLNMAKQGLIQRVFCGEQFEIQKVCFGNVRKDDFMEIWEKNDYQDFRGLYSRRLDVLGDVYGNIGIDMTSTNRLREAEIMAKEALKKNPVPGVCKTCYKAYGI